MQIGAALKQLLELDAELGPVLGTMASGKAPPSREQVARLAAKQKRVRGLLLQLKPTKLGKLPDRFPNLEAIGRPGEQSPADDSDDDSDDDTDCDTDYDAVDDSTDDSDDTDDDTADRW